MRLRMRSLLLLGTTSLVLQLFKPAHAAPLSPDAIVAGKSQAEWSAEWWKWAFSIPAAQNPFFDNTGEFSHLGDVGPVYFLSGVEDQTVTRPITVPAGKPLFFPVLGIVFYVVPELGETLADAQQAIDESFTDTTALRATLNGVPIPNLFSYAQRSPLFSVVIPPDGLGPPGSFSEALAGGYWLMLEPLPVGQHRLTFGGDIGGANPFTSDIAVVITVVPEPGSFGLIVCGAVVLYAGSAHRRLLKRFRAVH